tara:strand:- start:555 stop:1472 length:918 start_codon:yes stop_codon:yes gene_type:complete
MGTSRLKTRRRQDQGLKWPRILIAIFSTIGLIDTGSITLHRWGILGPLSCLGGADACNKVLNSPWGSFLLGNNINIPLSLIGFISYLVTVALALFPLIPSINEKKNNIYRRTWLGLFIISCLMSSFSLMLIGIMIFKIKAICLFCILSAILSCSIFLLSLKGGSWEDRGELIFRSFLIYILVILATLIWSSSIDPNKKEITLKGTPPAVISQSNPFKISLAKHLTTKGFVMYSAYWCPHCHDQKELFGKEASKELTIIECAKDGLNNQADLCELKGISGYPSWEIDGSIESGVKDLAELKKKSNF